MIILVIAQEQKCLTAIMQMSVSRLKIQRSSRRNTPHVCLVTGSTQFQPFETNLIDGIKSQGPVNTSACEYIGDGGLRKRKSWNGRGMGDH